MTPNTHTHNTHTHNTHNTHNAHNTLPTTPNQDNNDYPVDYEIDEESPKDVSKEVPTASKKKSSKSVLKALEDPSYYTAEQSHGVKVDDVYVALAAGDCVVTKNKEEVAFGSLIGADQEKIIVGISEIENLPKDLYHFFEKEIESNTQISTEKRLVSLEDLRDNYEGHGFIRKLLESRRKQRELIEQEKLRMKALAHNMKKRKDREQSEKSSYEASNNEKQLKIDNLEAEVATLRQSCQAIKQVINSLNT